MDDDALWMLGEQSREDSEVVLALLLAQDPAGAMREAEARDWPLVLVTHLTDCLAVAREQDDPMPADADPEEFLEYARGTNDSAREGFVALATVELLLNRVGSLSQCAFLAQWLVNRFLGAPVDPVEVDKADLMAHAETHPDAQYLVRRRASLWVTSAGHLSEGIVYGPQPGDRWHSADLDQAWFLQPRS